MSGLTRVETYARPTDLVDRPKPRREPAIQRRLYDAEETDISPSIDAPAESDSAPEPVMTSYAVIDEPVPFRAPLTRLADGDATAVLRLALPRPLQEAREAPAPGDAGMTPATEPQGPPIAAQRLTLGQSRRLGLGAPLSRRPDAAIQRSTDPPSLDLAPTVRVDRGDAAREPQAQDAEAEIAQAMPSTFGGLAPIVGAIIQRAANLGGTADQAAAESSLQGPASGPALELAPAFKPAPVHQPAQAVGRAVQRVVTTALPPIHPRPAAAPTAPITSNRPPLPIIRRLPDPMDSEGGAPEPGALQRLPVVSPAEPLAMLPRAEVRAATAPAGRFETAPARALPTLPPPGPLAPVVQRAGSATQDFVAFSPFVNRPQAAYAASSGPAGPAVQREVSADGAESEPAVTAAPAPSAVVGAAGAAGAGDKELDELARKLHDRISFQLRRELLIQRERAGMVTDLR